VVVDPAGPSGGRLTLFLTTSVDVGVNAALSLHRVSVAYPSLLDPTLEWTRQVPGAGPSCSANDLGISGDGLYVCGGTDDATKSPPANGGHWRSGMAARLSLAGDLVWSRIVRLSDRSEDLDVVVAMSDAVGFVGNGVRYMLSESKDLFGYGWITKLSPVTGDVLADFTFGDEGCQTVFNTAHFEAGRMRCGGWTRGEVQGGPNQAWYCEIDVSGTPGPAPRIPATRPPTGVALRDRSLSDSHR
jgi:hypothetical protein